MFHFVGIACFGNGTVEDDVFLATAVKRGLVRYCFLGQKKSPRCNERTLPPKLILTL